MPTLRTATPDDHDNLWSMLEPVFRAGDTYAIPRDIDRDAALAYWLEPGHEVLIAEEDGTALGTYFLCANGKGGGDHVANCGFVTAPGARGKGVARAMLEHSLRRARARGFRAMQFNFVVSTNTRAVAIWQHYDFRVVGRLPGAFHHPELGYVDALVMYKTL
ncbi:GNAT family N-acetyltransferase [Acidimangrovimonas sediminis]|uniref:GNAT family N-acetyltransferase n=1 Tax=Acidimangrovimonas sediminis TaxID=2056283 RepID=UPI000C803426|nr:GNAT family N-acetyltransferase [Acidimangrovimonas sediminis]